MKMTPTPKVPPINECGSKAGDVPGSVPDLTGIARPMLAIAPEEIGTILVFSDIGSEALPPRTEDIYENAYPNRHA
jgi:hypothetical protein